MPRNEQQETAQVKLGKGELARRTAGGLVVRETALRVRFELADLVTADAHRVSVRFECAVIPRPEAAERAMLAEAFLSQADTCSGADVVRTFTAALAAAARGEVAAMGVVECVSEDVKQRLAEKLRRAVDAAGFTTGLEAVAPYSVQVESPSLQRMELDRAAREEAERQQASRLAHLRRAGEVLKEFEAVRQAAPGVPVSVLLSRLSPAEQPSVVQGLLEAAPKGVAQTVYAVAGSCLLRISTEDLGIEEIALRAEDVGPFRSVQLVNAGEDARLAIGGRAGVVVLDPADPSGAVIYRAGDVASAMGFNKVIVHEGRALASHSELGVLAWSVGDRSGPPERLVEAGARNLEVAAGRIVYTAGARVLSVDAGAGSSDGEPIVGLMATPRELIAVHASGDVDVLDPQTLGLISRQRRSSRVTAAAMMPFFDSPRVLLASEDGPVTCLSPDDAVVTQYGTTHRGLRALVAGAGVIAGVSADRQRVVLIEPSAHSSGVREVYAGARVRHRVAGITLAR